MAARGERRSERKEGRIRVKLTADTLRRCILCALAARLARAVANVLPLHLFQHLVHLRLRNGPHR